MFTKKLLGSIGKNNTRPLYEQPLSTRLFCGSGLFLLGILGSLGDMSKRKAFFESVFNMFKNQFIMDNSRPVMAEPFEEIPGNRPDRPW